MSGFIVFDYESRYPLAEKQLAAWLKSGQIKRRETRYKGIDQCPTALMNLFKGSNTGKSIIDVAGGQQKL